MSLVPRGHVAPSRVVVRAVPDRGAARFGQAELLVALVPVASRDLHSVVQTRDVDQVTTGAVHPVDAVGVGLVRDAHVVELPTAEGGSGQVGLDHDPVGAELRGTARGHLAPESRTSGECEHRTEDQELDTKPQVTSLPLVLSGLITIIQLSDLVKDLMGDLTRASLPSYIMATNIGLFNYDLPESFIAQRSVEPRDSSKLMVVDRATGKLGHRVFSQIVDLLKAGDVLVFNTSKVFKARLVDNGVEVFLLKITDGEVECLIKPGRKFKEGDTVSMFGHDFLNATELRQGIRVLKTGMTAAEMMKFCDEHGQIPTPPYVRAASSVEEDYQTVYAKEVGSVAAPTAGFHFTNELLDKLKAKGVQIECVVLHVGIGTFRPVQVDTLEEHEMHSEWVSVPADVAERINDAKAGGHRVIAVGTTTTRVLEAVASQNAGKLVAYEGDVNMFITPGYEFKIIDGLITNFHLPKSTLLVLVSALVGREHILVAYEEAKKNQYRFFSFGDAMFIA